MKSAFYFNDEFVLIACIFCKMSTTTISKYEHSLSHWQTLYVANIFLRFCNFWKLTYDASLNSPSLYLVLSIEAVLLGGVGGRDGK